MPTTHTTDLKRELRSLYRPPRDPVLVDVPPLHYLAIDGEGRPGEGGSSRFEEAIRALYPVAYTVKFELRSAMGLDFTVMPLEALWRSVGLDGHDRNSGSDAGWDWTALILQADAVTAEMVGRIAGEVATSKDLPAAGNIRLRELHEGTAAQLLYVGPWADEGPTIELLHAFIVGQGLRPSGAHHEIYLSDPRRTAPDRLRTIIRQPIGIPSSIETPTDA